MRKVHSSFSILFFFSSSSLPDLKRRNINSTRPRPRAHYFGACERACDWYDFSRKKHAHARMDHRFWSVSKCLLHGRVLVSKMCRDRLFLVQHDCHPRFHVCVSCHSPASQRKHARHTSVRAMLHIESSRRFRRVRVNTCRAHMRIRSLASAGCMHVKLDHRFRHVCPFLVCRLPRKCCTCQIQPSFSTSSISAVC